MAASSVDVMPTLQDDQLDAIAEVRDLSRRLGVDVWLRGGWAVDFSVGRVTREHADVDWFVWSGHLAAVTAGLETAGWEPVVSEPPSVCRTLVRGEVYMCFQAMAPGPGAEAIIADGPQAGERWPERMIADAHVGRIGVHHCLTISPAAQVRLKRTSRTWNAGREMRTKDDADIAHLENALRLRA